MQKAVPNYPPLILLNPLKDAVGVSVVDYSAEFDGLYKRLNDVETLLEKKQAPGELIRYLGGLSQRSFGVSIKNLKKTNVANDILTTEITAKNFFAHWIKEIDIKCLSDDIPILPTTNTIDIYKYSNVMLKHLPEKALKVIENNLLYSKKKS